MKTLFLLRHAKSSWKDHSLDDFDRPLNKRGRGAAKAIGEYLANRGVAPAQVLCSSARRARETLERAQEALGVTVPARFEKGIYMAEAATLMRRLKRLNDTLASAMLLGHNPGLADLAQTLIDDGDETLREELQTKFPTASLAMIEAHIERWADLHAGCGRLVEFVRPRDLCTE